MSLLQCGTYACGTSIRPVFYFDIQRAGTLGWNHLAACMGVTPRCVLQQSQPVRWRMSKVRKDSVSFKGNADESLGEGKGLSRRSLLKKTAGAVVGAAAAGLTGTISARAQVQGLYTYNAPPELPLPMGSLTYLDRKQYIHNMEIVAHVPGSSISGGEPLMAMWAKGKQRLLPAGGDFVDVSDAKNPVLLFN